MTEQLSFRFAKPEDSELIFFFVKKLAEYQKMENDVLSSPEILRKELFENHRAEVLFAEEAGTPVAFAIFYHNFSTFLGKPGLYLDDLFVLPEHRGKGYGKSMLQELARIAVERNCGRFEWECLNWNKSSIKFYESLGAEGQDYWVIFRASGKSLENLAKK